MGFAGRQKSKHVPHPPKKNASAVCRRMRWTMY
jgi:hypothetical protein